VEKVKEMLGDIVTECHTRSTEQQKAEGYIKLERGFATIPLPGILSILVRFYFLI
jgi:fatty acid synthase subunit alpha, fungi type